jgi:hypothetical protein
MLLTLANEEALRSSSIILVSNVFDDSTKKSEDEIKRDLQVDQMPYVELFFCEVCAQTGIGLDKLNEILCEVALGEI